MRCRRDALLSLLALAALALAGGPARAQSDAEVTVFAAASLTSALAEIDDGYRRAGLGSLRLVHAASSTLAKQIGHGAPADLFISANIQWMDYLQAEGAIEPQSRVALLGNSLVLIAPKSRPLDLQIAHSFPLAEALGERRLAIGDPGHVPAGLYAKATLETLGVWDAVAPKAAYAADVRAALALVERGAAGAGIVYASDAAISTRVQVVGGFPADSHPPIRYPMAIVAGHDGAPVRRLLAYLRGDEAAAVFARHGFELLAPGS